MIAVLARLARTPGFWAWLPVVVLPPVLVLDAVLSPHHGKDVTVVSVLTAVVACLPLVIRDRLPFVLLAPLLTAGIVLVLWQLEPGDTVVLIPAVALAELASRTDRRQLVKIAFGVTPCVMISIAPFADDGGEFFNLVLRNLAFCFLALAAGDAVRSRREAVERAAAASEEQARRRLGDERLRIARDVHDVVAHAMVEINVQAGVAAHLIDRNPDQARSALRHIKAASGEALSDLRATLGVLRGADGAAPVEPTAAVDDLEELAAGLRSAGVTVAFAVDPLPAGAGAVQAVVYRIVQEALTNVLRHAGASRVEVRVARDGDAVDVSVRDDGTGGGPTSGGERGAGQGLRGMRERAAAVGGTVESGPAPGGGWRVAARLPVRLGTAA
jgi:signal transduction histidine kinase